MLVAVQHHITDSRKWPKVVESLTDKIPTGLSVLQYTPNAEYTMANCLWEAQSLEKLKKFLEDGLRGVSRNEYFVVDATKSQGLPEMVH